MVNFEGGLTITSPYGSTLGQEFSSRFGSEDVPTMGPSDDEEYFEYIFTANPVSGDGESDRCDYIPYSIRVTGEEQYFSMWICDSTTPRCSVRNATGNFKVGETITSAAGGTATVKEWHNFREPNGLDIIELDNPSGNFAGSVVTGSTSGATADAIGGWYDTPTSSQLGLYTIAIEPLTATLSGFYAYDKQVQYTKYLQPRCDTLVDICGPVAEYGQVDFGTSKPYAPCEVKDIGKKVEEQFGDIFGKPEIVCSRESVWPNSVDTGVYEPVPILGYKGTKGFEENYSEGEPVEFAQIENVPMMNEYKEIYEKYRKTLGNQCEPMTGEGIQTLIDEILEPADAVKNYNKIKNNSKTKEVLAGKQLDLGTEGVKDAIQKQKTFFCGQDDILGAQLAMADFIEVPVQSTVPSNWYKEIAQEWNTPSFRGIPPAGPSIKWSVFNYKPHKTGTKTFDYDITVCWYCSNATYVADPVPPTGEPGDPGYDPGSPGGPTANPGYGASVCHTYGSSNTIESNWSTHRDNLVDAVEEQGNPDSNLKIAQNVEFINPSEDEVILHDYEIAQFPSYGYIELNNYEFSGRSVVAVETLNLGLGYMNDPDVTVSEPDLEGGIQATVSALVTQGRVVGYEITNAGKGYVQEPIITVDPPDPVRTGTGDLLAGSRTIRNIDIDEYERLFYGIKVTAPGTQFEEQLFDRIIPGVAFTILADGSAVAQVQAIETFGNDIGLEDIEVGMDVDGLDVNNITVAQVDLITNQVTFSDVIAAGTYEINTRISARLQNPSNVTAAGANLTFTAPAMVNATARARLYLGSEGGQSYKYSGDREIAHYDGVEALDSGAYRLKNVLRGRKQTDIGQHLRNDHTLLHEYI